LILQPASKTHIRYTSFPGAGGRKDDTATRHEFGRSSNGISLLSAGYQKWIKVAAPGARAVREAGRAVERFIELFGDKPVAMITEDDLLNYRDFVEAMPANLSLPAMKANGLSLCQAVEQAWIEKPNRAKLSSTSVKKEMSAFSAIFGVLKSERWIRSNPAAAIPVSGYSKARNKQKSPRLPLRPNMMVDLFASPLFTGCVGPKIKSARSQARWSSKMSSTGHSFSGRHLVRALKRLARSPWTT